MIHKQTLLFFLFLFHLSIRADVPYKITYDNRGQGISGTTFYYHGSIQYVINGQVPPPLGQQWLDPNWVDVGFSVGSTLDLSDMGNMFVINGFCFSRNTNQSDPNYYQVIYGFEYVSTSSLYLLEGSVPDVGFSLNSPSGVSYTQVTNSLFQIMNNQPLCYVGLAEFNDLQGVAISKSPIYDQNIFSNPDIYFSQPPLNTSDVPLYGVVMGCIADLKNMPNSTFKSNLERVLYVNPFGQEEPLYEHVEVMQLNQPVKNRYEITPGMGIAIDHMLTQSIVNKLEIDIYQVNDLVPLIPGP